MGAELSIQPLYCGNHVKGVKSRHVCATRGTFRAYFLLTSQTDIDVIDSFLKAAAPWHVWAKRAAL